MEKSDETKRNWYDALKYCLETSPQEGFRAFLDYFTTPHAASPAPAPPGTRSGYPGAASPAKLHYVKITVPGWAVRAGFRWCVVRPGDPAVPTLWCQTFSEANLTADVLSKQVEPGYTVGQGVYQ